MNRGGSTASSRGFTIVETLIVLAVTGTLFVIIAVAINGRQQKTDFHVGVRNLQQQFQQIINETASGYYPSNGSFRCNVGLPTRPNLQLLGGTDEQGASRNCIFIGKTLVVGGAAHTDNYSVFSLAGRRVLADGITETRNPSEAKVTAIATSAVNPSTAFTDTEQNMKLPNGLTFVKARRVGSAWSTNEFAISFMSSFSNFQGSETYGTGGSQLLELRGFRNWVSSLPDVDAINRETTITPNFPLITRGVEMCYRSNGTNQSVLVSISGGLAVSYKIRNGVACA
ncbi:hypothetical protein CSA80_04290 [Candidatus Saccharibacteria bacterium]|nr:MAG: hypothetical protein CR973_01635 [Candidatus Saccharibacteria bacterium]PID98889.1 MAG: hypothetical protein CSA80_04290 [Candidatus Saccharibacteria bacterium]